MARTVPTTTLSARHAEVVASGKRTRAVCVAPTVTRTSGIVSNASCAPNVALWVNSNRAHHLSIGSGTESALVSTCCGPRMKAGCDGSRMS